MHHHTLQCTHAALDVKIPMEDDVACPWDSKLPSRTEIRLVLDSSVSDTLAMEMLPEEQGVNGHCLRITSQLTAARLEQSIRGNHAHVAAGGLNALGMRHSHSKQQQQAAHVTKCQQCAPSRFAFLSDGLC